MSQTPAPTLKPLSLSLASFSLLASGLSERPLAAQPIVPADDGTGTVIVPDGQRFDILGGTLSSDGANLFHSFQQFGLGADQIANFLANPNIQNILGRVVGGDPSVINGLIQLSGSNANLYLLNPAGIVFGPGASLNVPSDFFATTATGIGFSNGSWLEAFGSNDYHALVGQPQQFAFDGATAGAIANAGQLSVNPGRHLALIGGQVANTGELRAPGGQVTLSAVPGSSRLRLSQPGHLLSVEIEPPRTTAGALLPVTPQDLPALLTGSGLDTGLIARPENTIEFRATGQRVGLAEGTAAIAGRVEVGQADGPGGEIAVLGDRIALLAAELDASGATGGGSIRIGGEYQGQAGLPTARHTYVSPGTRLRADALTAGDGGRIILWADETTRFLGEISALGGPGGGDGGFVEVSGREFLAFNGSVDVSAPQGRDGTILLDPRDLFIGASGTNNAELDDGEILWNDSSLIDFSIAATHLATLSGTVRLEAWRNIYFNQAITFTNPINLVVNAANIHLNAPITFSDPSSTFTINTSSPNLSSFPTASIQVWADVTGADQLNFNALYAVNVHDNVNVSANTIDFFADTNQVDIEGSLTATNISLRSNRLIDIDDTGSLTGTNVTLIGPQAILFDNGSVVNSENVFLQTNDLRIWNGSSFSDNQNLVVEPATPPAGSDLNTILNHIQISPAELDDLLPGFASVIIGGLTLKEPPPPPVTPPPPPVTPPPVTPPPPPPAAPPLEPPPAASPPGAIETAPAAQESSAAATTNEDRPLQPASTRVSVEQALDSGDPGAALQALEGHFSQAFAQRLGRAVPDVSVPEFQERLKQLAAETQTEPAVIFVFVRREQLELMLVPTTGAPIRYRVPSAPGEAVLAQARALQDEIIDPTRRLTTSYLQPAQQLHRWVMEPLQGDLERLGIDTLLFSLDEGLRSLPLAALHDGRQFLIERYRFSVIPSLTLANLNYTDVRKANVLALGISEFQYLNPLPAVPMELTAIAQPGANRQAILNEGFTVANLKQQRQAARATVVHLATHAEFVPGDRGDSFIQFWERPLAFEEMLALDWQDPELALLVLSACRTALGDPEAEYGFAGLAVQAGVETAIASLWYANDIGTLGLMSEFYHHLGQTPLKSEALRQAQLALLRGDLHLQGQQLVSRSGRLNLPPDLDFITLDNFQHPYYWAGFAAIGNPW